MGLLISVFHLVFCIILPVCYAFLEINLFSPGSKYPRHMPRSILSYFSANVTKALSRLILPRAHLLGVAVLSNVNDDPCTNKQHAFDLAGFELAPEVGLDS